MGEAGKYSVCDYRQEKTPTCTQSPPLHHLVGLSGFFSSHSLCLCFVAQLWYDAADTCVGFLAGPRPQLHAISISQRCQVYVTEQKPEKHTDRQLCNRRTDRANRSMILDYPIHPAAAETPAPLVQKQPGWSWSVPQPSPGLPCGLVPAAPRTPTQGGILLASDQKPDQPQLTRFHAKRKRFHSSLMDYQTSQPVSKGR